MDRVGRTTRWDPSIMSSPTVHVQPQCGGDPKGSLDRFNGTSRVRTKRASRDRVSPQSSAWLPRASGTAHHTAVCNRPLRLMMPCGPGAVEVRASTGHPGQGVLTFVERSKSASPDSK